MLHSWLSPDTHVGDDLSDISPARTEYGPHWSATLGPGALVGELSLITGNARPVTAIALEETVVIRIPRTLFLKVLEGYPDAARALRDVIAQRLEHYTRDLAPVRARLALGLDDETA